MKYGEPTHPCPSCGGPLSPNSGGVGDSVIFAASPPEELCEFCFTGHSPGWMPWPEDDPSRWLHRRKFYQRLKARKERREEEYIAMRTHAREEFRKRRS